MPFDVTLFPVWASLSIAVSWASVLSQRLDDGPVERLSNVRAAPGKRRPRVDAEASEDAGERLGLEERSGYLLVGARRRRPVSVNDGLDRCAVPSEFLLHRR